MAKGQRNEKITPRNSQGAHQPDFGHRAPAPSFPVMGDKHARDDKPTAQTRNRCCILDDLSHRHRSRCNSYIESSKTRTNSAVTVARGAPALAAAVAPRHRLKTTLDVVPYVRSRTDERRINPPANFFSDEQPRRIVSARLICTRCHADVKSVLRCRACGALCPTSRIGSGMLSSRAFAFYVLALVVAAIFWFA